MQNISATTVLNAYDHRNRRIRKIVQRLHSTSAPPPAPPSGTDEWLTLETHTFVWDGNNIVLEKVEFADGTTRTFEYFWGLDKSGTEQGAGGVGALLAVSMDGVFYIPCYNHNGNVVLYLSETGAIAAQNTYDPYGNIIESTGPLADAFSFCFSTQYHDRETGMVGYKRRFYRPDLGRWLNRDPIEEEGGENLYAFCNNGMPYKFDALGTSTCCRNGKKENCDKFYKWEGTVTTTSLTWGLGATFLMIDIKSNFVCMTCSRWRIHIKAVLLTASLGAPFSLTGSNIEFGNVSPDAFVGSVSLIGAGVGAMGVVDASSLRIGNAWANNVGLVGGAELGTGGAYGWFVDFEMVEE